MVSMLDGFLVLRNLAALALVALAPGVCCEEPAESTAAVHEEQASRRMAALEETMNRLAALLESTEPANAQRLRDAYARAREAFIARNMEAIVQFLRSGELEEALARHTDVAAELRGLLSILSEGLVDEEAMRSELERLKKIKKKLAALEQKERREAEVTTELAAREAADPDQYKERSREQGETRDETAELSQEMAEGGESGEATPGSEEVEDAMGAMSDAIESLSQGQGKPAAANQTEAADKLAQAQDKIDAKIDEMENQLQSEVLLDLEALFIEMLEKQRDLTVATATLDTRLGPPESRKLTRKDSVSIARLARGERGLERSTEEGQAAVEEEGSSAVFPFVLEMLLIHLRETSRLLNQHVTWTPTHEEQKQVEQLLEDMIAALAKELAARQQNGCGT